MRRVVPIICVLLVAVAIAAEPPGQTPASTALPPTARRLVLAIDGSGSMKDSVGSTTLGLALGDFIGKLGPEDELALVAFNARPALLRIPAPVGASPSAAIAQVQGLLYDGQHSDLPAALAMACDVFPPEPGRRTDIVLVTDGVVTVRAPRSAASAIDDMKTHVLPRCVAAGARIHVIGLGGEKVNTPILQSLAEASDGRAEFPLSASRLSGFLGGYLQATAPPPAPPKAAPAAARATTPQPPLAIERETTIGPLAVVLALASLVLALLLAGWALRNRRSRQPAINPEGRISVRELASGAEHSLSLPAIIGRSPSSPITVDDKEASRRHVRFEMHEGKLAVVDLDSSNGTFVNGARLTAGERRVVRPGDRMKIPGLELLIQPMALDADATYIRQDLDGTLIRPLRPD